LRLLRLDRLTIRGRMPLARGAAKLTPAGEAIDPDYALDAKDGTSPLVTMGLAAATPPAT
jgi:hypothetical protein